jgi:uncharacterized membrane protein YfcA
MERHEMIDYNFLFTFTVLSVAGIFIGFRAALKRTPAQIKRMFGWFVLVMGVCIFVKEVFLN